MSTDGTPKVSVVIATYNYARFLPDALGSVQAQTLADWECIIADDASTDGTAEVVRKYTDADKRFLYMRLPVNGGVAAARNAGLAQARGRYIQLLDADDVLGPRKLELHTAFLEENADVAVVYSDFFRFTESPETPEGGGYKQEEQLTAAGKQVLTRLIPGNIFRLNTVLFRKEVLARIQGFRAEFRYVEDWDFWLQIAATDARFAYIDVPEARCGVRLNPGSLSSDRPAMRKYQMRVRHSLWHEGGLSWGQRFRLLLRSADFYLHMRLVHKEPVIFLDEADDGFRGRVRAMAVLVRPFWFVLNRVLRPIRQSSGSTASTPRMENLQP